MTRMGSKAISATLLLGVAALVSGVLSSTGEAAAIGPILRLLPQELAGLVGMALAGGRWVIPLILLTLALLIKLRLNVALTGALLIAATIGRSIASFASDPPAQISHVFGELVTEFLLIGILVLPASLLAVAVTRIVTSKEKLE